MRLFIYNHISTLDPCNLSATPFCAIPSSIWASEPINTLVAARVARVAPAAEIFGVRPPPEGAAVRVAPGAVAVGAEAAARAVAGRRARSVAITND